MKTHVKDMFI